MHLGSLCIGIVDYEHPAYGSSSRRLRFATSDARAFCDYLKSASAGTDGARSHALLLDRDATLPNALARLAELTAVGEFDLFVLYLAGHGERGDSNGGWFCLADSSPNSRSLDASALERVLNAVSAHSVLVVVDCCHAEALLGGMRYFSTLTQEKARLFVASARRDQLAWEDTRLKRSVLSDVFLRACSTASPIQSTFGKVQIESRLFPYLREQVPLLAAAQKQGSVQEPVTGGTSRSEVELPVVDSKSFGRALTIAQTVRERLRQVLVRGTLAVVATLVLVQMLTYHLAADSAGRILVRPGLPLTHALVPAILSGEVDTGLRVDQLDRDQDDASAIAESRLWGLSSHLSDSGIRPWFSQVAQRLATSSRVRVQTLAAAAETSLLPADSRPPLDQVLFLSQLRRERPAVSAATLYEPRENDVIECTPGRTRKLDFSLLSVPPAPYARDLWWQGLIATGDALRTDEAVRSQVQNTAYRSREAKELDDVIADIHSLAISLASIRRTPHSPDALRSALIPLLGTPCRSHAALALRLLGLSVDSEQLEKPLVRDVLSFDREKQGDLPNAEQTTAAHALAQMAGASPLQRSTIEALASALVDTDPQLDRPTLPRTVLATVASVQPLPRSLIDHLVARLEAPERQHEFGHLAALNLLSRNLPHLPPDAAKRVGVWLDSNAQRLHAMSDVHSAAGFLLAHDSAPRTRLVQLLVNQLSPDTYFPSPALGYRGELTLYATGDAAAIALGRTLQSRSLPEDLIDRLSRFAIGRPEAQDRQVVVDGLAKHWYATTPTPEAIHVRLAGARDDARKRGLEVEAACSRLLGVASGTRDGVRDGLLGLWKSETEPEVRVALATVVARSQWPRHGDMTMCASR